MRRTFKTFALAGMCALGLALSSAIPAQAAARLNESTYVALGDSYSSGALLGGDLSPITVCDRSSSAYPVALAGGTNFVSFKACSGATIADTVALLPAVPLPNVKVVTLTMGFNDTHWAAAVAMMLAYGPVAAQGLLAQTATDIGLVAAQLPGLITELRTAYPKATIYWAGYVQQFGPAEHAAAGCQVWYGSPADLKSAVLPNELAVYLDDLVSNMNLAIQSSITYAPATGAPITYVNADALFNGQRACNNTAPAVFNLHPTVAGQLLYAQAFKTAGAGK